MEYRMKTGIIRSGLIKTATPARLSLLALAMISSPIVSAAEDGWYLGLNVGESLTDIDDVRITERLQARGFRNPILTDKEGDNGRKSFVGYQFNENFAIEGGYFKLGKFGSNVNMSPNSNRRFDVKMRGINVDLVSILPITERFSAFGRAGVIYSDVQERHWGFGPVPFNSYRVRDRDTSYKFGVGLQYDFTERLAMRLEAERYHIDHTTGSSGDADLFSVGVVYRFGQTAAPAAAPVSTPVATQAPRAVAPAPAPAPAPVAEPVRVTLSADSLFGFDSAVVSPAGRAELDSLAVDLRGIDYDTIRVTGHTDRIGDQAYNLRLSNERAVAVRNYLVESAGIAASSITTRGVNGAEPVTTAEQCSNQLSRAQLIACVAPDRRVEVEVTGTRPR